MSHPENIENLATLMLRGYGGRALTEADMRLGEMIEDGDADGACLWRDVRAAIRIRSDRAPGKGESSLISGTNVIDCRSRFRGRVH